MTKYLDLKNGCNETDLKSAANIIKNGGIVLFPTETVYGIGTNALDENAVKKLYEIKQRPFTKQIPILVDSLSMIESLTIEVTNSEKKIIKKFLPGPLTIVLNVNDKLPQIVTAGHKTNGMRIPANEIAFKLVEYSGVPIATTSANISGKPSLTELSFNIQYFENKVDCIIDGGPCKIGLSSTVVQMINNKPFIIREGPVSEDDIKKILK